MDPVEFRRRNLLREGDDGPTGQVMERSVRSRRSNARRARSAGAGRCRTARRSGSRRGWWPSFPGAVRRIREDQLGRLGTIITGAQECGTGAVMALPILAAEVLGMRPDEFRIVYQDTDAGP